MKLLVLLAVGALFATARANYLCDIDASACCKVCEYIVTHIEDGGACDVVAVAATDYIETYLDGVASSYVRDGVDDICNDVVNDIVSYESQGAEAICKSASYCGGEDWSHWRRDLGEDLDEVTKKKALHLFLVGAAVELSRDHGHPVAVFSNGEQGNCWPDRDTGMFTCSHPTTHFQAALPNFASGVNLAASTTSSTSEDRTGLIVVGTVLGCLLVVIIVLMVLSLSRQQKAQLPPYPSLHADTDLHEQLLCTET